MNKLIIDNSLVSQLLEELADVAADFGWIRDAKLVLQFFDEFSEGSLAVTTFENLPACALQFYRALGKQNDTFLFGPAPAATRCQTRLAGIFRRRHPTSSQSGRRPAEAIPAAHTRSKARRVAPTECRICRAKPASPVPVRRAFSRCRRHSLRRIASPPGPGTTAPRNNRDRRRARGSAGVIYRRAR